MIGRTISVFALPEHSNKNSNFNAKAHTGSNASLLLTFLQAYRVWRRNSFLLLIVANTPPRKARQHLRTEYAILPPKSGVG